jgi:hypothetical protein
MKSLNPGLPAPDTSGVGGHGREKEASVFTEAKSRLGWRTGASRGALKEQRQLLQSFDPVERARAGQQLVALGLARSAEPLLDHVRNEFDNRVLSAVATAVLQAPTEPKEPRKVQELREWAAAEVERSALEDAFLGSEPESVAFPPLPDFQSIALDREPLPVRVPAVTGVAPESDVDTAPESIEDRFDVPEPAPEAEPTEDRPVEHEVAEPAPETVEYRFAVPEPGPESIEYRFEASESDAPAYIFWRAPASDEFSTPLSGNGHSGENGHDPEDWADAAAATPIPEDFAVEEAELVEDDPEPEPVADDPEPEPVEDDPEPEPVADDPEPEPVEDDHESESEDAFEAGAHHGQAYRLEAAAETGEHPAPEIEEHPDEAPSSGETQEYRFEPPEPVDEDGAEPPEPAPGAARTLAERLRARYA